MAMLEEIDHLSSRGSFDHQEAMDMMRKEVRSREEELGRAGGQITSKGPSSASSLGLCFRQASDG
eukprot:765386-Hanusia_phi.AAC.10